MAKQKVKTVFVCQNCGTKSPKWNGKCSGCGEWNTIVEEKEVPKPASNRGWTPVVKQENRFQLLDDVVSKKADRIAFTDEELNRVLGGGVVPGSLVLLGGEPGIGKSTLLLQMALNNAHLKVAYISGEESAEQIKIRAERIGGLNRSCFVLTETRTAEIFNVLDKHPFDLVIVDSVQTLYTDVLDSSPGSVSQIRETAAEFLRFSKASGIPVVLVGHITKDGSIAGPKVLEHMVDVVLQFEGDRNFMYRLLRGVKNRFGSTHELGIYEMKNEGMIPVSNAGKVLLSDLSEDFSGVGIGCALEGNRTFLVEIQALVSTAVYGTPQRSTTGFDLRRLNMLLAVLEKRCKFKLGAKDVFLNITGGLKVEDPALDLAVVVGVLSSTADFPIPRDVVFVSEVGLSWELRPVSRIEQRLQEVEKLGFRKAYISGFGETKFRKLGLELVVCNKVEEVVASLFG